jgi:hypothetical protein
MPEPSWKVGWGRPDPELASQFLGTRPSTFRISRRWVSTLAAALTLWAAIGNAPWHIVSSSFRALPSLVISHDLSELASLPAMQALTRSQQSQSPATSSTVVNASPPTLVDVLINTVLVDQALAGSIDRLSKEAQP